MPDDVESFIHEYARRYTAGDVEGVTDMCSHPFLVIRSGKPIHLPDRDAVREDFAGRIDTYRGGGAASWSPVEIEVTQLGEHAAFATVHWNAITARGT